MSAIDVSIIIVGYQGLEDLRELLPSLVQDRTVSQEIIFVDNASTDGSSEFLAQHYPEVHLLRNEENLGWGGPCNQAARVARGKVLAFLNCDIVVETGWLAPLVAALADPSVGAAMPRLLIYGTSQVNTLGTCVHWTGFGWMDRWLEPDPGPEAPVKEVFAAPGGAAAFRADAFREVGGFAEDYFLYYEDVDLSWRLRMHGYKVLLVPASAIYHKYEFGGSTRKWYFAERNRVKALLTNYHWSTLVLLAPGLLMAEVAMFAYAVKAGFLRAKCRATHDVLAGLGAQWAQRRSVQRSRRVGDRAIWGRLSGSADFLRASTKYARVQNEVARGASRRANTRTGPR